MRLENNGRANTKHITGQLIKLFMPSFLITDRLTKTAVNSFYPPSRVFRSLNERIIQWKKYNISRHWLPLHAAQNRASFYGINGPAIYVCDWNECRSKAKSSTTNHSLRKVAKRQRSNIEFFILLWWLQVSRSVEDEDVFKKALALLTSVLRETKRL